MRTKSLSLVALLCICCVCSTEEAADAQSAPPQSIAPDPFAALPKLAADQARIFFLRDSRFVGVASDAKIIINGVKSAWVGSGSAVFVDHAPGQVVVSIGGGNSFALNLEPGKEYFVTLAARAHALALGALPFLMESVANQGIPQDHCGWDWCASIIDKQTALPVITTLSISGPNPNAD